MASSATSRALRVHFSKSSYGLFTDCPQRWAWEKLERRPPDEDVDEGGSPALQRGRVAHEAVAGLLVGGHDPRRSEQAEQVARDLLDRGGLPPEECQRLLPGILEAAELAFSRGGELMAVEQLMNMLRLRGVVVWGKFDVAIRDGSVAPIEPSSRAPAP